MYANNTSCENCLRGQKSPPERESHFLKISTSINMFTCHCSINFYLKINNVRCSLIIDFDPGPLSSI